jgi:hypothetical protein
LPGYDQLSLRDKGRCVPYRTKAIPQKFYVPVFAFTDARGLSSKMQELGKIVMIIGIILAIAGVLLWKFPGWFGWMGRLPGDFSFQKGNFSFYFPIVTCILISIVLTLLSWLFRR